MNIARLNFLWQRFAYTSPSTDDGNFEAKQLKRFPICSFMLFEVNFSK